VSAATGTMAAGPPVAADVGSASTGRPGRALAAVPGVAAAVLWRLSLRHVNAGNLGEYGLPAALPAGWYVALAVAVLGAVTALTRRGKHPLLAAGYVCLVAVMLYGTVPVLSPEPHYAWTYKHVGVVRYLEANGTVSPNVDIYNRWPGFFALAAVFSTLVGDRDPVAYAAWADLAFTLLDLALVVAVVNVIVRRLRVALAAGLLFLLTNWVGQTYFSPQAFGYLLGLALILIVVSQLSTGLTPPRLTRLTERVVRRPQLPGEPPTGTWPKAAATVAVVALDAAVVASHQLTPYMLLVAVALLTVLGTVRPWWLLAVLAAITFGYLAANLDFIQHNYGLFTSIDPFNNVQGPKITQHPSPGKVFNTDVELLFIAAVWAGTCLAVWRLARRGLAVRALALVVLAFSPAAIVFGQNYGGEATLRVILFSSPWCSALIVWAIFTIDARHARAAALATVAVVFTGLFVVSYLGQEELNILSPAEVSASAWFYRHAHRGSVLVLAAPGFPYRYGASYPSFRGPEGDANPNLMTEPAFQGRQLGAAQVAGVAERINVYAKTGYIAFTHDEQTFAEVFRITPPGALQRLRAAVARSPRFRLAYANPDAQIYELQPPRATAAPRVSHHGPRNAGRRGSAATPRGVRR